LVDSFENCWHPAVFNICTVLNKSSLFRLPKGKIMSNRFKSLCRLGLAAVAGAVISSFAQSAKAENFDNNFVRFEKDTQVEFEFIESRGAYQSTFGVINLVSGEKTPLLAEAKPSDDPSLTSPRSRDFLGTPGNTVPQPISEFLFKAGQPYAFYLESTYQGREAGTVYSSNNRNIGGQLQSKVADISGLSSQGLRIEWDDTGSVLSRRDDRDFNDFQVIAGGNATTGCRKY
jgi:hypothetical protein